MCDSPGCFLNNIIINNNLLCYRYSIPAALWCAWRSPVLQRQCQGLYQLWICMSCMSAQGLRVVGIPSIHCLATIPITGWLKYLLSVVAMDTKCLLALKLTWVNGLTVQSQRIQNLYKAVYIELTYVSHVLWVPPLMLQRVHFSDSVGSILPAEVLCRKRGDTDVVRPAPGFRMVGNKFLTHKSKHLFRKHIYGFLCIRKVISIQVGLSNWIPCNHGNWPLLYHTRKFQESMS